MPNVVTQNELILAEALRKIITLHDASAHEGVISECRICDVAKEALYDTAR